MLEKSGQQFDADVPPLSQPGAMPVRRPGLSRLWFPSGFLMGVYLLFTGLCGPVPSEPARQHPAAYVTKNVEDLVVGDQVLAEDPATGEKSLRRVVEVYRRRVDHLQIVVLRGSDGSEQTFETTAEHPFWVAGQGWVQAAELQAGQRIRQADGKAAVVVCSRLEPHPEGVEVFHCQVAGLHSYFVVARGSRGPPVLVHNNDDCKKLIQIGLDRVRKAAQAGSNAPARLTWQELSAADRQLLNESLHGRQPHSALGRLSPQQLDAALDYYQATGAAGRGTLPSELVRDFNQARVDFLRTGSGQPPGGVYDFAEGWLQRQTPEWLEANRDAVSRLRQAIETMRRRGGGG